MSKKELFSRYIQDKLTPEELQELFTHYNEEDLNEVLREMQSLPALENSEDERDRQEIFNNILSRIEEKKRINWMRVAVAAAFIGLIAGSSWFYLHKQPITPIHKSPNKAMLVLANGQHIQLNNASTGNIAKQGDIQIVKSDSNLLVYNGQQTNAPVGYNTLSTPRGGQFQVQLPDGSHVWLNAASSLRYPAAFTGDKREVELTGEAYFEVAKDERKPFEVKVKDLSVKVLGTAFNIMAYEDEAAIKTTLVQGAIKVNDQLLHPGEQLSANTIIHPNMKEVLSWKEGKFWFDGVDMKTIMRQISRWYNVEVLYEGGDIEKIEFTGIIARTEKVSQLLEALEQTGNVHFKVIDKTIVVLPGAK